MPPDTSGPNNGSTFANDATVGTIDWNNPSYAQTSNDIRADASLSPGEITRYLKATGFGFAIPTGATIDGILVEVERRSGGHNVIKDYSVKIVKGGVISGSEKATATWWPLSDAYASYGGATDLWGLTWTAADINAATFGVVVSAQCIADERSDSAEIDHIRITIYYTSITQHKIYVRYVHLVK